MIALSLVRSTGKFLVAVRFTVLNCLFAITLLVACGDDTPPTNAPEPVSTDTLVAAPPCEVVAKSDLYSIV